MSVLGEGWVTSGVVLSAVDNARVPLPNDISGHIRVVSNSFSLIKKVLTHVHKVNLLYISITPSNKLNSFPFPTLFSSLSFNFSISLLFSNSLAYIKVDLKPTLSLGKVLFFILFHGKFGHESCFSHFGVLCLYYGMN